MQPTKSLMLMRRSLLAVFASLLLGCTTGGVGGAGSLENSVTIMKDSAVGHYHPSDLQIDAGGSVIWTNKSGVVHNVVFESPIIRSSGFIKDGDTFETDFANPGTYPYLCTLHPTMRGTIVVE